MIHYPKKVLTDYAVSDPYPILLSIPCEVFKQMRQARKPALDYLTDEGWGNENAMPQILFETILRRAATAGERGGGGVANTQNTIE